MRGVAITVRVTVYSLLVLLGTYAYCVYEMEF